jgi:hypothetical protein
VPISAAVRISAAMVVEVGIGARVMCCDVSEVIEEERPEWCSGQETRQDATTCWR